MAERRLDLYELDAREPVAFVDRDGIVRPSAGALLPTVLFAELPTPLHLSAGITIAPLSDASEATGPERGAPDARTPRQQAMAALERLIVAQGFWQSTLAGPVSACHAAIAAAPRAGIPNERDVEAARGLDAETGERP
jgi:hypothetical protein